MLSTIKCPHCGSELKAIETHVCGNKFQIGNEKCYCEQAIKEREGIAQAEAEERFLLGEKKRLSRYVRAGIKPRFINAEADCEKYIEKISLGKGLYIQGSFGTGKTYLANAIAKSCCDKKMTVRVTSTLAILSDLRKTFGGGSTEEEVFAALSRCKLLVIDDLGKEAPTEWVLSMLFRVINDRYEELLPVVITTNYGKTDLIEKLAGGDKNRRDTATAIVSRIFETCEKVECTGGDRRLRG